MSEEWKASARGVNGVQGSVYEWAAAVQVVSESRCLLRTSIPHHRRGKGKLTLIHDELTLCRIPYLGSCVEVAHFDFFDVSEARLGLTLDALLPGTAYTRSRDCQTSSWRCVKVAWPKSRTNHG